MDSQLERPISERMLAVDRRGAGRNAGLFERCALFRPFQYCMGLFETIFGISVKFMA